MLGRRLCCAYALAFALACAERSANDDADVSPGPGYQGGLCLAPDGHCGEGATCNREGNYCYDPDDPCEGFACGGSERGVCVPVDGQPTCECNEGFDNSRFALYCCPTAGGDPDCA